jgi:hydroxymethylglutaryl-CoA lyase
MLAELFGLFPKVAFSLHLHDTRGLGLANVIAGLEQGVNTFDSSIGGLGGCPVVPGGAGNISTEDLVNMLSEMGIDTGVNVPAVMEISRMAQEFLGRRLPSHVLQAGTRAQLFQKLALVEEAR